MANQYTSMENLRFLLHDVHKAEELFTHERFQDYDVDGVNILLDAAKDVADKEMFPYFEEMDTKPVRYEDGKVIVHPQIEKIIKLGGENGWIGSYFDYEKGGMQLPQMVHGSLFHLFDAANNNVSGYLNLTTGAANLIVSYGSQELYDQYVPNMISGKWMGSMALTEPQAGSSLSDVKTSATPSKDGSYQIKGQKIFISGGDHQYAENFVHLTLARIDGAPAGTKGISLFVVPKFRITADGGLEPNDVFTAGDFQKLGQRGYATTHLVFGEESNCQGWLVGEPNKGLKYMFQMMNEARLSVGSAATAVATAAYHASLQYAKERPQGRKIQSSGAKNAETEQTLIINHPDVRRMLLLQKAIVEGSQSLLMECGKYVDMIDVTTGEEKERYHLLLEMLTPIAKTYPSEMGRVSIDNGLQILGGYGFCMDFPLQQYYRDIRIMALYEGTTGIQSLDLLGRKATMKNGKALQLLMGEMQTTIKEAMTHDELKKYANVLVEKLGVTQEVLQHLIPFAMKGNYERFLADATMFMEMTSTVVIAWQWLKQAIVAKNALVTGKMQYDATFYESKIHTMKFYFKYEVTKINGLAEILKNTEEVLTIMNEKEVIV